MQCHYACAHLLSPNFPSRYNSKDRRQWRITTADNSYIELYFIDYGDHVHECTGNVATIFDVDLVGGQSKIVETCSFRSSEVIKSSWNRLVVEFISEAESAGEGFHAVYHQKFYSPPSHIISSVNVTHSTFYTCNV